MDNKKEEGLRVRKLDAPTPSPCQIPVFAIHLIVEYKILPESFMNIYEKRI
jgi:hypothetical protein